LPSRVMTLMVGDRRYDIEAAHQLGIDALGVGYGYGTPEELAAAGPDYLALTVEDLQTILTDI